ncbi:MAG: VWA domain-containing protein [Phycisphaerales bacterium]|nr:VWA domain-containing protein [Phycisphaerales bacterium]
MRPDRKIRRAPARRGVAVVYVAISMTVVFGMAAMAVDIGALYAAKAELQRAADAAALAAASELVDVETVEGAERVFAMADAYARENTVIGRVPGLATADVEFGKAEPDGERFRFETSNNVVDAVRVTVRRSQGSEAGPMNFMFATIFGYHTRDLEATAAAMLIPRDMSVIIDLSNSMNWDSQLRYWARDDGGYSNLRDIWAAMDGPEPSRPYIPGSELETEYASDTGPTFGEMTTWGTPLIGGYDPSSDPGLWEIRKGSNTVNATISARLAARGYSSDEITQLMSRNYDSSSSTYENRVAVIMGLADWRSGRPGGRASGGDGDARVESNELTWINTPSFELSWDWRDYIQYVYNSSNMRNNVSEFRYRYGLKTFTDFMLDSEPESTSTYGLYNTPQEPLRAVKDAVQIMVDTIEAQDNLDQLALQIFATTARTEVSLTDALDETPTVLYKRQSGHYDRATNIGGGLATAIAHLRSPVARENAKKVIVLMSDGVANIDENGNSVGDGAEGARSYALDQAQQAADYGYTIYTVSVGYNVDRELMQEIAALGKGQEFYAVGSPEEYTEQLEDIFKRLGGKRPVALIE